jgi:Uma2 family endonuclease
LELEEASLEKNEFYKGEIFAMAGRSIEHNQITRNTMFVIDGYLSKADKCQIFPSDLKIHALTNSLFTYPDLSIVCGKIETLLNKRKKFYLKPHKIMTEVQSLNYIEI